MSLRVTRVGLRDFRSYHELEIEPDARLTVVVGPNAVGKTNIVEAVQLLTAADSFRKPQWSECVRWGASAARLELDAEGESRRLQIQLDVSTAGRRGYKINGTHKRRLSEVVGRIPCVVFTPDDLQMVKGSADRRRAAVDGVGDQLSAAYAASRAEYERILRQRNALLRNGEAVGQELDAWTEQLVASGETFSSHRRRLFDLLAAKVKERYSGLAGSETLEADYVTSWEKPAPKTEAAFATMGDALVARRAEEVARGTTLVGPHRDEIAFRIDGRDARAYASQGQQRTIALAWKLAEVSVITDIANQPPVLLLDDVMSELDESRRHALAAVVGEAAQTFMTTTNIGYFDPELIVRAKVVDLGE